MGSPKLDNPTACGELLADAFEALPEFDLDAAAIERMAGGYWCLLTGGHRAEPERAARALADKLRWRYYRAARNLSTQAKADLEFRTARAWDSLVGHMLFEALGGISGGVRRLRAELWPGVAEA